MHVKAKENNFKNIYIEYIILVIVMNESRPYLNSHPLMVQEREKGDRAVKCWLELRMFLRGRSPGFVHLEGKKPSDDVKM